MRNILRNVWEVYERDTQRCVAFATKEEAEDQNVFDEIDYLGLTNVYFTDEEIMILNNGGHVWIEQ